MNEAQTLLEIENFMLKATKRTYRWTHFKADYDELKRAAEAVYDPKCEYSPLVQAYFNLLPEHTSFENLEVFKDSRAFSYFQRELIEEHEYFLDKFSSNNRRNRNHLKEYFNELVESHRKLLLVRVDLSYSLNDQPGIKQFERDLNKLVRRIQDKDTIFKDQVGYVYRLEQGGKSRGYHCHLLVIYNGSLRVRDDYLAQSIGELWLEKITKEDGIFFNCNQASHKKYYKDLDQLGIGMIERRNLKEVENAWLAISYLADPQKDKQYLRASVQGMRQFSKGQSKPRARSGKRLILKNHRYISLT